MKLAVVQSKIAGEILVPGSKSHTIRALAIAAMAKGSSIIRAPLISGDTISCLTAVSALGAWVRRGDDTFWKITGTGGKIMQPAKVLNLNNSGTGIKFLAALASLSNQKISFDGDDSLRSRPMQPLLSALKELGVNAESADGKCPFSVQGPLTGGTAEVEGKSSQYLSSLLLAAPLAAGKTTLQVHDLKEIPYVKMTLDWLKKQNIKLKAASNLSSFQIEGGQSYTPFTAKIPGDFSTAAFPLVAAAVTGGKVSLYNLDFNDLQGDKAIFEILEKMGAKVSIGKECVTLSSKGKLQGREFDLNATPDLLPALAVAAACASGTTVFKNVAQARIKETDRIHLMTTELRRLGIQVDEFEDGMTITGGKMNPAHVDSGSDHRIAMALAIAGMTIANAETPTVIDHAESISVTYPGFIGDFTRLGAHFYEM